MTDRLSSDNETPGEESETVSPEYGDVYDPLAHAQRSGLRKWVRAPEMPFVLVGSGLLVLIAVFIFCAPGHSGPSSSVMSRIDEIERKLEQIETIAERLTEAERAARRLEEQAGICERFSDRFESMEAALNMRVDRIARDLDRFKKSGTRVAAARDLKPVSGDGENHAVYHSVKSGETLYRISQRYGVSIRGIQKLNGLTDSDTIYTGQKLLVRKSSTMAR